MGPKSTLSLFPEFHSSVSPSDSESVLTRFAGVSAQNSPPDLTLAQRQVDEMTGRFVQEATDWQSLAAVMAGGVAYRAGKIGILAGSERILGTSTARLFPLVYGASLGGGLATEVAAYECTRRSLASAVILAKAKNPAENAKEVKLLWSWDGKGGIQEGSFSSFITFGSLKGFGSLARGQNAVAQHAFQDLGMVLGHQGAHAAGLGEKPQGTLTEQFLHARATGLQMAAGTSLAHTMTGGRIFALERGMDLALRAQGFDDSFDAARFRENIRQLAGSMMVLGMNGAIGDWVAPPRSEEHFPAWVETPSPVYGLEISETPRFLGYEVSSQMVRGLRTFVSTEESSPFVDFSAEGARAMLDERNARRHTEGFADFGHVVDRHSFASTSRGELRAGIYGENVDIESLSRETIRKWDQATLTYDAEGRTIFMLQRTFSQDIGVDSNRKSTRTHQLIVSAAGEILSSFPVPEGTKGWVPHREMVATGKSFQELLIARSASAEMIQRHSPFLPDNPDADRRHLYLAHSIPFGIVNQRTVAYLREGAACAQAGAPYTLGDGTTVINARGERGAVMVAEMKYENPIGVRETVREDGQVERTPLRWNRAYYAEFQVISSRDGTSRTERVFLGGYPILDPSESHLPDHVWNPLLRLQTAAPAAAPRGNQSGRRNNPPR